MKPPLIDLFIGSFSDPGSVDLPDGVSLAGNYFQNKLIGIFNPVFSVSFIYQGSDDRSAGNERSGIVFLKHGKPLRNLFACTGFLFRRLIRKPVERVMMYNFNIYYLPVFLYFRFLARKKVVVIVADAPFLVGRSLLNRLLHRMVLASTGIITLRRIRELNGRHPLTDVIPGIITRQLISRGNSKTVDTVLMSGSLGFTTGLIQALEFFSRQDKFRLFITGKPYLMTEKAFADILARYPSGSVVYLGALPFGEYAALLSSCEYGLALRDPADIEHDYNFPSKIIEYMSGGTIVITSIEYPELDRSTYFVTCFSPAGLKECFEKLGRMGSEEKLAHTENARKKTEDLCSEERIREKVEKLFYGN